MAFTYKFTVGPAAYERLYAEMAKAGDASVKQTIKRLLLAGAWDDEAIAEAIRRAHERAQVRRG